MILHEHKIIFVHIPKTAGQSVTNYFLNNIGKDFTLDLPEFGLLENVNLEMPGPQNHHHMYLDEYVDLGYVKKDELKNYFKFCVIRNPLDRFRSSFYYNRMHKKFSYKTFLNKVLPRRTEGYERTDLYRHFCPQTNYINSEYGRIDKFFLMDEYFSINFENYFQEHYGFTGSLEKDINKTNVKEEKVWEFDDKIKAKLNKVYKNDVKLYRTLLKHRFDHQAI